MRPFHMNNTSHYGQQRPQNTFQPPGQSPSYQHQAWGSGYTDGYYGNYGNSNHGNGINTQNTNSMRNNGNVPYQKNSDIDRNGNCNRNMGKHSPQGGKFMSTSFQHVNPNRSAAAPWNNGQNYEQFPYKQNYDSERKGPYCNKPGNNYFIDSGNNSQSYKPQTWQNQTFQPSMSNDRKYNKWNKPNQYNKPSYNRGKPGRESGDQSQNHQPNGGGKNSGKKKKVDKRELPENNVFFCDTCDRGFPNEEKYTAHTSEHQQCSYEGCPYVAAPRLVQLHIRLQHSNGMAKKIWSLESAEDIQKWKEERRKNFPTADNIAKKNNLIEERKARGEVLETKYFGKMKGKNYNKQDIGSHDNRDVTEVQEVSDRRNGRKRKRNRRKKFGPHTTEENEGSEIKIPRLDEPDTKTEEISQDALTGNNEREGSKLDNSSEVKGVSKNAEGETCNVQKTTEENCGIKRQERNQKQQQRKNENKRKTQEPKKRRFRNPSLLEKLLANDIRHERNVLLQCMYYVVKKNFFGIGHSPSTSTGTKPSPSNGPITAAADLEDSTFNGPISNVPGVSMSDRPTPTEPSTPSGLMSTAKELSMSNGPISSVSDICTYDGGTHSATEHSISNIPKSPAMEPSVSNMQYSSETIQTEK